MNKEAQIRQKPIYLPIKLYEEFEQKTGKEPGISWSYIIRKILKKLEG